MLTCSGCGVARFCSEVLQHVVFKSRHGAPPGPGPTGQFFAPRNTTVTKVTDLPFPLHGTSPVAPFTPSLLILYMPILS